MNTDTCNIQDLVVASGVVVTIVIHDDDEGGPKDVFRCLVAGLWCYDRRSLDGLDAVAWRASYMALLAGHGRAE